MGISFNAVPANAIASGLFIESQYKKSSPQLPIPERIALLGQYNTGYSPTPNLPIAISSADELAVLSGQGSLSHMMGRKLFDSIGSNTVLVDWFPIVAGTGTATGTITVSGTATSTGVLSLYVNADKVAVSVTSGTVQNDIATAIGAAINANLNLPVTATVATNVVTLTSKFVGLAGNGINLRQNIQTTDVAGTPTGSTVVIVAMSGGLTNPSIQTALTNFGGTFYTFVVLPYNDDTTLDISEAEGTLRDSPTIKRPFVGCVGFNGTRAEYITWLESRNSQWTTSFPVENSPNHPAEIASSLAGEWAVSAQVDPSRQARSLPLKGIVDGGYAPWTYAQRNAVVALGGSTYITDSSGVVRIDDLVTTYTTNSLGAVDESYRYPESITNTQAKIYSMEQLLLSEPYTQAKIVDDDAVTSQAYAVRPKTLKADIIKLIDELWIAQAWSKNRDSIVSGIVCEINALNPNRIDVLIPDIQVVGLKIIAVKYNWSFSV